jgi:hypothetical protein
MEEAPEIFNFQIIIESTEMDESTDYWQKQCSILYRELHKNLISGSIEPTTSECEDGERADIDVLLHLLLASGITLEAFDRMYDVFKLWLEFRNSAKVTLTYEDGSAIELTRLSKSEALKLMERHQQRIKE